MSTILHFKNMTWKEVEGLKDCDQVSSERIALIKRKNFKKEKLNGDYCTSRLQHM